MSRSQQQIEPRADFDEAHIRSEMAIIEKRFPQERQKMKDAVIALGKKEAMAHLAITFRQPELLTSEQARAYLQKAVDEGKKLTETDKEALVTLEVQAERIAYDLAKFDCDTSSKHYEKLAPQLSYLQSEMKLT